MSVSRAGVRQQPITRRDLYDLAQRIVHSAAAERAAQHGQSNRWRAVSAELARAVIAYLRTPAPLK